MFLQLGTCQMPFLTVFVTAAEVHLSIDAAVLQEGQARGAEARIQGDVEAAVTIKEGGILAILHKVFLIGQEHRHLGAILRSDKHLLGGEVGRVEVDLRRTEHRGLVLFDVIFEDGGRIDKRGEAVVDLRFVVAAAETDFAESGQLDLVEHGTIHIVDVSVVGSILVVSDNHLAIGQLCRNQHVVRLRDEILPILHLWSLGRSTDHTAFRSIVIGEDVNHIVDDIDGHVLVVHVVRNLHKLAFRILHIPDPQRATSALTTFEEEHVMLILGEVHLMEIARLGRVAIE